MVSTTQHDINAREQPPDAQLTALPATARLGLHRLHRCIPTSTPASALLTSPLAMSSVGLSAVVLCVALLAALLLSHFVPTLRLPPASVSSSAVLEAAYLGDLDELRRLLASRANQTQHSPPTAAALVRDSRNNTALHVSTQQPASQPATQPLGHETVTHPLHCTALLAASGL